jgi:hypothetical protein
MKKFVTAVAAVALAASMAFGISKAMAYDTPDCFCDPTFGCHCPDDQGI